MSGPTARLSDLAITLIAGGILHEAGEVDVGFYAIRANVSAPAVIQALEEMAALGLVSVEPGWRCVECGTTNSLTTLACHDCDLPKIDDAELVPRFLRGPQSRGRDPAALFLIHGMSTLGDWQQSLAWKVQLLYNYSLPVFVFKFGRDILSPLTRSSQRRRMRELGAAVRQVQGELAAAGRSNRCDVLAHSFGTLLLAILLRTSEFDDLEFGHVILTGSIVPTSFPWDEVTSAGRIEALLNHRAGRDIWVRVAPWFFPGVGRSGVDGFQPKASVRDIMTATFRHSDYFRDEYFGRVVAQTWTPFLNGAPAPHDQGLARQSPARPSTWTSQQHWLGRIVLCVAAVTGAVVLLKLASWLGTVSRYFLVLLGL